MGEPSIGWNSTGEYRRIWLDMAVLDTNGAIARLQQQLARALPEGVTAIAQRGEMHMTLVYVGRPHELLAEVRKANSSLELPSFLRLLEGMLGDWHEEQLILPQKLPVKGLELFGSAKWPVAVLTLEADRQLNEARSKLWRRFEQFLADCGIADVELFVKKSPSLRTSRPQAYRPHVSVFRSSAESQLPQLNLPASVDLDGLQYHGVAFL